MTADIGGDLKIESRQDTYRMRSSQTGLSLSLGTGLGQAGWSGDVAGMAGQVWDKSAASLGNRAAGQQRTAGIGITYGRGSADKAWTENVTVIAGAKTADLKVAGNTHLKGAVVGVEGGEVRLDTGTFTYEDLRDYDRSKNLSLNVNLSYSWMGESEKGGQAPAGQQQAAAPAHADSWHKNIPVKVEGSYEAKDKEGVTRATVGAGTVAARDGAKQRELEDGGKTGKLAAVNRDLSKTQEVTKNERKYAKIYASDTSVKEAVKAVRYAGEQLSSFLSAVIDKMSAPEEVSGEQKQALKRLAKAYLEDAEVRRQILQCATQQTYDYNPLRLFIGTAYAANACTVSVAGTAETLTPGEANAVINVLRAIAANGLEGLEITAGAAGTAVAAPALALVFLIASTTSTAGPQKQTIELANGVTLELTINNDTGDHSAQFTMADGSRTVIDFRNNSQWYEIAGAYQILADGSQMDLPRDEIGRAADAVASATGYKLRQEKGVAPGTVLSENVKDEGKDKTAGEKEAKPAGVSDTDAGDSVADDVNIDDKIKAQLGARGWTEQEIKDIAKTPPAGTTEDKRRPEKTSDGLGRDDSATVYGSKDEGHVVINDRTKEVVHVSDKNDANWIPDSRIKWNK